jgi:hypothetical protein
MADPSPDQLETEYHATLPPAAKEGAPPTGVTIDEALDDEGLDDDLRSMLESMPVSTYRKLQPRFRLTRHSDGAWRIDLDHKL